MTEDEVDRLVSVTVTLTPNDKSIFHELVKAGVRASLEAVKNEHRRLELSQEGRHSFEQDWDALKDWLDQQLGS